MIMIPLFWLMFALVVVQLVRWGNGTRRVGMADPAATAEIARLREELDRLTGQVERLTEEQGFLLRLLETGGAAGRREEPALSSGSPPHPTGDETAGPHPSQPGDSNGHARGHGELPAPAGAALRRDRAGDVGGTGG